MATFFGEVTEIPSRAVFWSDSEEEEEEENEDRIKPKEEMKQDHLLPSLDYTSDKKLKEFHATCRILFVSLNKSVFPTNQTDDQTFNSAPFCLHRLPEQPDSYWLQLTRLEQCGFKPAQIAAWIGDTLLGASPNKSSIAIVLVSKNISRASYLQYITDVASSYSHSKVPSKARPLVPPLTLSDPYELALLEYCIVYKCSFICYILPSTIELTEDVDENDGKIIIPTCIIKSISESYYNLSYISNIIT